MSPSIHTQPHLYTDEGDEMFGGGVDVEEDYLEDQFLEDQFLEDQLMSEEAEVPARSARQPRVVQRKFLGIRWSTTPNYGLKEMIADKDYNAVITSYFVPLFAVGVGVVWGSRQLMGKYNEKMESVLDSYAEEMVYHDGDFEEMKMCFEDYKKRLASLGPKKKDRMIQRYLEVFSKKKPVSPQAISSLSHVFSMYSLTEEQAAKILVKVAQNLTDKLASAGKLLFFGEHILKSPQGLQALQPIRTMLAANYKAAGDKIVENSQKTMGQAAYRATVSAAGKNQDTLTPGWEVLGLDRDTAQKIFDELADLDFKSTREQLYGGVRQKYDDKGRKIDAGGNLIDEKDIAEEQNSQNSDSDAPSGSVYECEECGYTLFPAQGREFKFFPDDFKCPECGAAKDKFKDKSKDE